MTNFTEQALPVLLIVNYAAIIAATLTDFFTRKIPNIHCAAMALPAVIYGLLAGVNGAISHLLCGLVVLAIGIVLFRRKILGGGDVKMLAALALWFLPNQLTYFVLMTLICGGVVGAIFLTGIIISILINRWAPNLKVPLMRLDQGMPYSLAIAGGFTAAALRVF